MLQGKIDGLRVTRQEKDEVLKKQNKERSILEDEKKEKDAVVNKLKSQEKELKKEMVAKQKQDHEAGGFDVGVDTREAKETAVRESKKTGAAEKTAATVKNTNHGYTGCNAGGSLTGTGAAAKPKAAATVFETEKDMRLSGSFEKNKGHLPWPVSEGTISMSYGLHEYIKGVSHFNEGITIDVNAGVAVKAVFEGVVEGVFLVGDVNGVMIRHGKYFTTYSNLSTVSVTKGEQVGTGQIIGRVADIGQLEFLLSDEKDHMFDPEKWLHR